MTELTTYSPEVALALQPSTPVKVVASRGLGRGAKVAERIAVVPGRRETRKSSKGVRGAVILSRRLHRSRGGGKGVAIS